MITVNPFIENVLNVPPLAMQGFLILMVILTVGGVLLDMMHKKNVKFFFENAIKKQNYLQPIQYQQVRKCQLL